MIRNILLLMIIWLLMMILGDMPKRTTAACNPHSTTIVPKGNSEKPAMPRSHDGVL